MSLTQQIKCLGIEKEASQIIGLEEEEKKAESNESETWKNGEKDDKNSQADDIEETISAKKAAMKRTSKVHTTEEVKQHQRHEHGSLGKLVFPLPFNSSF